jgi:hypothetical protein
LKLRHRYLWPAWTGAYKHLKLFGVGYFDLKRERKVQRQTADLTIQMLKDGSWLGVAYSSLMLVGFLVK